MSWAVFLDRDGVLTDAPIADGRAGSPRRANELLLLPGVADAVAAIREQGAARIFVITNQPDVARGTLRPDELAAMHDQLRSKLDIDEIRCCPHDESDGCQCRKPRPGMLVDLARAWNVDLSRSWTVGDRWVDIAAGSAAGTGTILIERPYSWSSTSAGLPAPDLSPGHRVADLSAAVELIGRMPGRRAPLP